MSNTDILDPTIRSHLVTRQRRSVEDTSPLRTEELDEVQQDVGERVRSYLDFLKRVGNRDLQQAIAQHRATIVNGVQEGIVESTRRPTRAGEPPRRTRGMDIAKAALGQRPSFLVMDNEICLEGSLAHPSGWENLLAQPEVRKALKPRLAAVGMIMDDITTALGTGFVVAQNLVMTNRHVVEQMFDFGSSVGPPQFLVKNARWLISFSEDAGINTTGTKSVRALVTGLCFVTPETISTPSANQPCLFSQVDVALLRIEPLKGAVLPVLPTDWTTPLMVKPPILVVGHPCDNPDYRETYNKERDSSSLSFDAVFGKELQCKHVSPGYSMPYFVPSNRGNGETAARFQPACGYIHDASTLGGNSGSPILNLSGEHRAIGLHFWGQAATSAEQVANLAHVLGAVLDAPNLPALREFGGTLRAVLAAHEIDGPGWQPSPVGSASANENLSRGGRRDAQVESVESGKTRRSNTSHRSLNSHPPKAGQVPKSSS
jgi:hypothetical protein